VYLDQAGSVSEFTYDQLEEAVKTLVYDLEKRGITEGDRVAICFPPSPELLVSYLAVFRLGAICVPVSVLSENDTVEYCLKHAAVSTILIDSSIRDDFQQLFNTTNIARIISVPLDASDELTAESEAEALGGYNDIVSNGKSARVVKTAPDDPALILYTSGSTGVPKGVVQGHQYLIGSLPGYQCWYELFEPTELASARVWTPAEWAWAGALFDVVFPTLAAGGTVIARTRRRGFNPSSALSLVESQRVTHSFLPPTALRRIRDETSPSDYDLSPLEIIMCGAEPLTESVRSWAQDALGVTVNEAYGQTEANAILGESTALYPQEDGTTGLSYPGHTVAVQQENSRQETGRGELLVNSDDPVVFNKYWNNPEATSTAFTEDGWLKTGDEATIQENGYVSIEGRVDDIIITSGYRVSPKEIESKLESHPNVEAVVVSGVPHSGRGTVIKAFVVPIDKGKLQNDGKDERYRKLESELTSLAKNTLDEYKKPREYEFLETIPKTRNGKIDRAALLDRDF